MGESPEGSVFRNVVDEMTSSVTATRESIKKLREQ